MYFGQFRGGIIRRYRRAWQNRSGTEGPGGSPARDSDTGNARIGTGQGLPEEGRATEFSLDLPAARVTRYLIFAALILTLVSFAVGSVGLFGGPFLRLFYVGGDLSLPAWYSALTLALASVLLFTLAFIVRSSASPSYARRWAVLGAIFAYLSCDEMLRLHERMADTLLSPALESVGFIPGGVLYYPWVLIYAPLVAIFILAYFKFWLALPPRIRTLFLAAGAIFVGGAIGVELFNAYHDDSPGREALVFAGTHIEELMEMVGVVVFIHAILAYIVSHLRVRTLRLCLKRSRETSLS